MAIRIKTSEYARRLEAAGKSLRDRKVDALLVTPGPDLTYLSGYRATALERLTCLIVRPDSPPTIVVPALEVLAAEASPLKELDAQILGWEETQSPHKLVAKQLRKAGKVTVDARMWVRHLFAFQESLPLARFAEDRTVPDLRAVKSKPEIKALKEAGAAIDRVHERVPHLLQPGLTERQVGAKIAELIIAEGHETVDFVIVASGPNGASPHHEVSDRVIEVGDAVVVDIGGTMPSGYCSDCTRTYAVGAPPEQFAEAYHVLRTAQSAARKHAAVGVTAESVDAAARDILAAAGLGKAFVHRTGHGIGTETHEDPYIVSGNKTKLKAGNAFSIEPGFYLPGRYGARIEDIVVVTDEGLVTCNNESRDLLIAAV